MPNNDDRNEIYKQLFDKTFLKGMVDDVYKLPERMERGLKLVYPEKQYHFVDKLIELTRLGGASLMDVALDVSEALQNGASIKKASDIIKNMDPFGQGIVRGHVLNYSKRGPEFYRATLPIPFESLPFQDQIEVLEIERDNLIYEKMASERDNGTMLEKKCRL